MELTEWNINLSFSVNHPERQLGEVWLHNVTLDDNDLERDYYTPYYDLRFGKVAYDNKVKPLDFLKPVFGKRK